MFLFLYSTRMYLSQFNNFTIISTPVCVVYLYCIGGWESQGSSCSVQPIAIGYCTRQWMAHPVFIIPANTAVIGSACPGWFDVICKYVTCGLWFGKVLSHPNIGWAPSPRSRGHPLNFVFKRTMLIVETLSCFAVKTAWSYLQSFCHSTLVSQTDRWHAVTKAALCNATATFR